MTHSPAASSAEPDGFTDGWTVKYTKFALVYKDIAPAQKTGALVLGLTKPGPTTLLSFPATPSGKWDRVSYALAPDATAQAVGDIAAADAEKMRSEGLDLWLEGTGTKDAAVKHFSWKFSQDTLFEDSFGTALAHELEGHPLSLTVFAPGGIQTEMTSGKSFSTLTKWLAPVDVTATAGLKAMRRRELLAVPGFLNQLGVFAFRFAPRSFAMGRLASTYRKALLDAGVKE